ncbi:hypothetical protein IC620_01315 [Hazenella sp. IB182357]|uniref:Uncharacterized protein n=1 Tax=Polycladospora coralii TaxID=2771432 RepID=A0A926N703_9BACL|nr:hypothetical protein [Polycladospora coralii]MBD1371001.1 hypothetical protein [Polycladospora coralii]MBS7529940.1 hypothetical protein [Polycladospora coralii]
MTPSNLLDFDKTYQIGSSTIHIVAIKQTEEEKKQQLKEIVSLIEVLLSKNTNN